MKLPELEKGPLIASIVGATLAGILLSNALLYEPKDDIQEPKTEVVEESTVDPTRPAEVQIQPGDIEAMNKTTETGMEFSFEETTDEFEELRRMTPNDAGSYNYLKRASTDRTYASRDDETYKRDVDVNKQTIEDLILATFDYLGGMNNWHAIGWGDQTPKRVSADDGIFDYFIQEADLVNKFVSTLNVSVTPTLAENPPNYGQPGQPTPISLPTLGDKYYLEYLEIEDLSNIDDDPYHQTFKVLFGYTVDNYKFENEDDQMISVSVDLTFNTDNVVSKVKFIELTGPQN